MTHRGRQVDQTIKRLWQVSLVYLCICAKGNFHTARTRFQNYRIRQIEFSKLTNFVEIFHKFCGKPVEKFSTNFVENPIENDNMIAAVILVALIFEHALLPY